MLMKKDLIVGIHSILHAIKNPLRQNKCLYISPSAQPEFDRQKQLLGIDTREVKIIKESEDKIQAYAAVEYKKMGFEYKRVPGNLYLLTDALPELSWNQFVDKVTVGEFKKILCLDQITDIHNMGALFRTAAFYKVDAILLSRKGEMGLPPSFFRISSGGSEYVELIKVNNLSRAITQLIEIGTICIGLSEHQGEEFTLRQGPLCLVLGSEDQGLSNAVERSLKHFVKLENKGSIQTLNVSVAGAIAMERFF
jgi:23S rRNA (guanosine2251-2'-O)-methyltransferase